MSSSKSDSQIAATPPTETPDSTNKQNAYGLLGRVAAQFAPLKVPLPRRRQMFAVLVMYSLQLTCMVASFLLLRYARGIVLYMFLAYLAYIFLVDDLRQNEHCISLSDDLEVVQGLLIKTTDLDPTKNYVFGYHPHGIIGTGAMTNFATEATGVSELLPGLKIHLLTLASNFRIPFFREHLKMLGVRDSSKEACVNILSAGPGESLMLVIGGAAEALDARPGKYILTLKNRKGFVKVALRAGASLVPVFGFGENDLYDQVSNKEGSKLRTYQHKLQKLLGFSMPLFHGRGVFNYAFGLLPYRKPITCVIGRPVECPKISEPTTEDIDKYHDLYLAELRSVWNEHKETLTRDRTSSLTLK